VLEKSAEKPTQTGCGIRPPACPPIFVHGSGCGCGSGFFALYWCPESDRNFNQNHPIVNQIRRENAKVRENTNEARVCPIYFFATNLAQYRNYSGFKTKLVSSSRFHSVNG
jgi:hypothetical protein